MMGDGVIELDKIRNWIKDAGYNGYIEVEILSQNNWWRKSADEIIMICLERYKKFL